VTRRACRYALASLLLAALLCPGRARADNDSEAKLHTEIGRNLYLKSNFVEALPHFTEAFRLVPTSPRALAISQTYEQLMKKEDAARRPKGPSPRAVDAYNWLERYLEFSDLSATERRDGEGRRAAFAHRVAIFDVQSTPSGAAVYLDDESQGIRARTPRRLAVMPGEHTVIVRLDGHHAARAPAPGQLGQVSAISVALTPTLGKLHVEAKPAGLRVRTEPGGRDLGVSPLDVMVPAGPLRLRLSAAGYLDDVRDVVVEDGQSVAVTVVLQRASSTVAVLSVRGEPEGATVRLDGRDLGRTPLTVAELGPGRGTIEIAAPGRKTLVTPIILEAGGATRVDVTLVSATKPRSRWWRWVGFGGGAALLAAGAVVGVKAQNEKESFYDNPQSGTPGYVNNVLNPTADALMAAGLVAITATALVTLFEKAPPESHASVTIAR
jgi:hypothetical protein